MWSETDRQYMEMAIELANKGIGYVNPNPLVGAVIVKDGRIIGRGWHHIYGGPHAERDALSSCVESPEGATMYVTLEPCCHYGKQPPCTEAIIQSGIKRVVIGMTDPNVLVKGGGIARLQDCGIVAETGLLEDKIKQQNRVFIKYITTKRPWIVLKCAMTIDGRIASYTGDSKWISSEQSRLFVHTLRGSFMGIVAGAGTVKHDDPMLNCRIEGMKSPIRILPDSKASLSLDSQIAMTADRYRTIVVHTDKASVERIEGLHSRGVETMECLSQDGIVDLEDMLGKIGEMGIDSLLLEGGAALNWSFVSRGLVDEYYVFIAPKIIGGKAAAGPIGGEGFPLMADAMEIDIESVRNISVDWLIHGYAKKYSKCLQG